MLQVSAGVTRWGHSQRPVTQTPASVSVSTVSAGSAVTDVNRRTGESSSVPTVQATKDAFVSSTTQFPTGLTDQFISD